MMHYTESQARELSGDELNKAVEVIIFRDNLSCFDSEGKEREERIRQCLRGFRQEWDSCNWWYELPSSSHRFSVNRIKSLLDVEDIERVKRDTDWNFWTNRQGKPYQQDLETHINAWRTKPRDFAGDMNLAMTLWRPEFALLSKGDGFEVSLINSIGDPEDVYGDKLGQAICRSAVIIKLREKA